MPSPRIVKKYFGFPSEGDYIGKTEVVSESMGHIQMERYRLYELPFKFIFRGEPPEWIKKRFKKGTSKIVYTRYGNPYQCDITKVSERNSGDLVIIKGDIRCVKV